MRMIAPGLLVVVALAALAPGCKSTGAGNVASVKEGERTDDAPAPQIQGDCFLRRKKRNASDANIYFHIEPSCGAHSVTVKVGANGTPAPLAGFSEALVQIHGKDIYVEGSGDGDAGYFSVRKNPNGKDFSGYAVFPSGSQPGLGLNKERGSYRVSCKGQMVALAQTTEIVAAQSFPDSMICRMIAKRQKPYYMFAIKFDGDTAQVGSMRFDDFSQSTQVPAPMPQRMEGFENSTVHVDRNFIQVEGAGDGDAGYFNLYRRDEPATYGGSLKFPNSAGLEGLKGDGRRYKLVCDAASQQPVSAEFPEYFDAIEKEFGDDIYVGDDAGWIRLKGVTQENLQKKVMAKFSKAAREVMAFKPIKSPSKFEAELNGIVAGNPHGATAWRILSEGSEKKAQVAWYTANGEDGIFMIYGFVIFDPKTGTALMLFTEGAA